MWKLNYHETWKLNNIEIYIYIYIYIIYRWKDLHYLRECFAFACWQEDFQDSEFLDLVAVFLSFRSGNFCGWNLILLPITAIMGIRSEIWFGSHGPGPVLILVGIPYIMSLYRGIDRNIHLPRSMWFGLPQNLTIVQVQIPRCITVKWSLLTASMDYKTYIPCDLSFYRSVTIVG